MTVRAHGSRFGYGVIETTLICIVLVILGFTTWFVHISTASTRKTLEATNKVAQAPSAPAASSQPAPASTTKAAPDSSAPAAGTCMTTNGDMVMVTLAEGVPEPRCSQVTAAQTLTVANPGTTDVTVTLGGQSVVVPAGKSGVIAVPFGDYLQPGDHVMQTGLYGSSGPEVYLPPS